MIDRTMPLDNSNDESSRLLCNEHQRDDDVTVVIDEECHNVETTEGDEAKALFTLLEQNKESDFCDRFNKLEAGVQKEYLLSVHKHSTLKQAVKLLLDKGAGIDNIPIKYVIDCEHYDIVEMIHNHCTKNGIHHTDEYNQTLLHLLCQQDNPKLIEDNQRLLRLLCQHNPELTEDKQDINKQDILGNTPLHYAVQYSNYKTVKLLLQNNAYIGVVNNNKETPITYMPLPWLHKYLNKCLSTEGSFGKDAANDGDRFITFDLQLFKLREPIAIETSPLSILSRHKKLRQILKHPVASYYIDLKFNKIKMFYYTNVLLHFCFSLMLTGFILCEQKQMNTTDNNQYTLAEFLRCIVVMLTGILTFKELFLFYLDFKKYILNFESLLTLATIIITICIVAFGCNITIDCSQMFALAILSCWMKFVFVIGKHPKFAIQIEMFKRVSKTFLEFFYIYVIIFIMFALSFYCLFRKCNTTDCPTNYFSSPFTSVFKIWVMATGEYDFSNVNFVNYSGTSYLLVILFIFVIVLVVVNLLNGLAVSEIQDVLNDAIIRSYISRVSLILDYEMLFLDEHKYKPGWVKAITKYFSSSIHLFAKNSEAKVKVYPRKGNIVVYEDKQHFKLSKRIVESAEHIIYMKQNKIKIENVEVKNLFRQLDRYFTMNYQM